MPTGDTSAFQTIAIIAISALSAYSGGRFHQWYKHGLDRDRSFREGYTHGYRTLFPLASRSIHPTESTPGPSTPGPSSRNEDRAAEPRQG
ncbi:hypothetical protein [Actinoplanes sp. NPDC051851]|uniref:hypothetical protein n=1 Tax=Actinoplanes sp. NPDC051851 TaxID=3154753 RepID=UPI0034498472